jgi:ribonuclease P protein component
MVFGCACAPAPAARSSLLAAARAVLDCRPDLHRTSRVVRVLPAQNRLRRTQEFRSTVRRGIRVGRPLVVVHVVPGGGAGEPVRAGFIVSGAVGGAVVRNAVRRRLRHLVRDRLDRLPAGTHVIVRARPEAAVAPSQALARDLDSAFGELADEAVRTR